MHNGIHAKWDLDWLVLMILGFTLTGLGVVYPHIEDPILAAMAIVFTLMQITSTKSLPIPQLDSSSQTVVSALFSTITDSFVIILGVSKKLTNGSRDSLMRNQFLSVVVIAALTFGSSYWIGELYALPYYIAHGMQNDPKAGLPMLALLVPVLALLAFLALRFRAMDTSKAKFDLRNGIESAVAIAALILTHNPLLVSGLFLIYEANFWGQDGAKYVIHSLNEELKEGGGWVVFLLIFGSMLARETVIGERIAYATGLEVSFASAVSSPMTGALIHADNMQEWYSKMGYLISGSFLFPWSSLVGVMVIKPRYWLTYMTYSIPLFIIFTTGHYILDEWNVYVQIAEFLDVHWVGTGSAH